MMQLSLSCVQKEYTNEIQWHISRLHQISSSIIRHHQQFHINNYYLHENKVPIRPVPAVSEKPALPQKAYNLGQCCRFPQNHIILRDLCRATLKDTKRRPLWNVGQLSRSSAAPLVPSPSPSITRAAPDVSKQLTGWSKKHFRACEISPQHYNPE